MTAGRECVLLNCVTGETLRTISEVSGFPVSDLRTSPDGSYFAVLGANEKQVLVWRYALCVCLEMRCGVSVNCVEYGW